MNALIQVLTRMQIISQNADEGKKREIIPKVRLLSIIKYL